MVLFEIHQRFKGRFFKELPVSHEEMMRYDDMISLHPFIEGLLEFKKLFSDNGSLQNQYKYIALNIFSYRILTIP